MYDLDRDYVGDVFVPRYDLGAFRDVTAGLCRYLILARWRVESGFLDDRSLRRWELEKIGRETRPAWRLLDRAAVHLAYLHREFVPRCGSGGVAITDEGTPEGRLIGRIADLVPAEGGGPDHTGALSEAARTLRAGGSVSWDQVFDSRLLPEIRDDLDRLPRSAASVGASLAELACGSRLLVVDGDDRRDAWWDGKEVAADWRRKDRAWRLLFELARRTRRGRGVEVEADRSDAVRGAREDLRRLLPKDLYRRISTRDGVYRLDLDRDEVRVMRSEFREYLIEG